MQGDIDALHPDDRKAELIARHQEQLIKTAAQQLNLARQVQSDHGRFGWDSVDMYDLLTALAPGEVIRWMLGRYLYVAVKVAGGHWYTSATEHNTMVTQAMTTLELANTLAKHSPAIHHATHWKRIV